MKKKICIIPFTKKEYLMVNELPQAYSIAALVSPKGIGQGGEDISVLKNMSETRHQFLNEIEEGIQCADIILISEVSKVEESLYAFALHALQKSIAAGKEILSFLELDSDEMEKYKEECRQNGIPHRFVEKNFLKYETPESGDVFHKFHIPVIYVGETIHDCDGYDVFLKLTKHLQRIGKKVLSVSQDLYNELFQQHQIQFWGKTSPTKMVYAINEQIFKLACQEKPDIILIKFPEPMIKYDDENPFDFGLTAFLLSQAVSGDACICCSYSGTPAFGFWNNINANFKAKFGYPLLAVHISNQIIDITDNSGISAVYIPNCELDSEIDLLNKSNEIAFYNLLNDGDMDKICELLVEDYFDFQYGVIER